MGYFVEFLRFENGKAEPQVVFRTAGPESVIDAMMKATELAGTMQAQHGALLYRLVERDGSVYMTKVFATDA
jgi:hypothetical protein